MNTQENQEHPNKIQKKHSLGRGPEPDSDVVIVVGDTEFFEFSYALRTWSGYFDAAFRRTDMNHQPGRFEFRDRDPEDWKLIKQLAAPFPEAQITKDNVFKILPWLVELCCRAGLQQCDKVLATDVVPELFPEEELKKTWLHVVAKMASNGASFSSESIEAGCFNLDPFLDLATKSIRHGLDQTAKTCFETLVQIVSKVPYLLAFPGRLTAIVAMMKESHECRELLWGEIAAVFGDKTNEATKNIDELLANPLLPTTLANGLESLTLGEAFVYTLRRAAKDDVLKQDETFGPLIRHFRK